MTTLDALPYAAGLSECSIGDGTIKEVTGNATRTSTWTSDRDRSQLVTLYNQAMASQWNSVTELDWATPVDPEQLVDHTGPLMSLMRATAKVKGSPIASWGGAEFNTLGVEMLKAQLSQFMHGEQGAMLTAAKIVETVPWIDAKYYAATQTMDEARHTEVFAKYLHTKVGEAYPMSPFLEAQITALMEDGRWDIAYLGMQIVIESLALAAFGDMLRRTEEPLLKKLLRYVLSDEARHVAFGVLSLSEFYAGLSSAELKERQDFLLENTLRARSRSTTPEVWDRMGVSMEALLPALHEAASSVKVSPFIGFQRGFFAKLVPNVRKLGLLDANNGYLRTEWGKAGLLEFEFADDTGSDYESYDAVAQDRAAATA
ncbi:MAG: ferritin-like domain-containing protein [Acidimicrobiales bacterium]